jgi:hypothetical protein
VRKRDPRRLLARRQLPAQVRIVETPAVSGSGDGGTQSRQIAAVTLPRAELDRLWTPANLERLARSYWAYLSRISLGLLRVVYGEDSRQVVLVTRPLVLLRFQAPEYELDARRGAVVWRIERGLLVARAGRGRGYLRIAVERPPGGNGETMTVRVSSEVTSFYPMLAAARPGGRAGALGRLAAWFYAQTQLRIHVVVTNGFLRSLARLELPESVVGALLGEPAA